MSTLSVYVFNSQSVGQGIFHMSEQSKFRFFWAADFLFRAEIGRSLRNFKSGNCINY